MFWINKYFFLLYPYLWTYIKIIYPQNIDSNLITHYFIFFILCNYISSKMLCIDHYLTLRCYHWSHNLKRYMRPLVKVRCLPLLLHCELFMFRLLIMFVLCFMINKNTSTTHTFYFHTLYLSL